MTHSKTVFMLMFAGIVLVFSFGTSHALPTTPSDYDWVNSAYWSLTDKTTATDGEATFTLALEKAAYESNFGFYTLNDLHHPETPKRYQVFGADQEPGDALSPTQQSVFFQDTNSGWEISLDNNHWSKFDHTFGFYFQVRDTGHTYYSDSRLNSSSDERTNNHVLTAFNGNNSAFIYLEDLPGLGDRDFQDMVIQGIDLAPAPAPVPEPATLVLLGVGLLGIAGIHRRKVNQK